MPICGSDRAAAKALSEMAKARGKPRSKGCPICGKPAAEASRPFCSERCKALDLHRWLSGAYVIPVVDGEDGGDDGPKPPKPSDDS